MHEQALSKLVIASGNAGKCREFARLLSPLGVEVVSQAELGLTAAPEPHFTFLENALAKARHASRQSGCAALADDSGICVPALGGAPGVHSARYAEPEQGIDQDLLNNRKLVRALVNEPDKRAFYVAVLVLVLHPDDPLPVVSQGLWAGEVIDEPLGEHGFGYDPHFFLPDLGKTAAQIEPAHKNQISHRAQATHDLLRAVRARGLAR